MIDYSKLFEEHGEAYSEEHALGQNLFTTIVEDPGFGDHTVEPDAVESVHVIAEGQVTMLASRVRMLTGALRKTLNACFPYSDQGRAPWYQEALRVLRREDDGA